MIEPARFEEALDYEAPFLIEKLLKERISESRDDAEALFIEFKRFVVLDRTHPEKGWEIGSRRIDEVWHQFILFTAQYQSFCERYFGGFLHHFPSNAPNLPVQPAQAAGSAPPSFADFRAHYERRFGIPLSGWWFDEKAIHPNQRVIRAEGADELTIAVAGDLVSLRNQAGAVFSVSALATPALEFVTRTVAFYVRELPGGLVDEEKIALVELLITRGVLLLGS